MSEQAPVSPTGRSLEDIPHEGDAVDPSLARETYHKPKPASSLFIDGFFLFIAMICMLGGWGGAPGFAACVAVALGYYFMSRYEKARKIRLEAMELSPQQMQQKQEKILRFCRTWFFHLLCLFGGYCFLVAWILGAMFAFNLLMQLYGAMRCAFDEGCEQQVQDDSGFWWLFMVLLTVLIPTLFVELFSSGWVMISSVCSGRELLELKRWSLRTKPHVHQGTAIEIARDGTRERCAVQHVHSIESIAYHIAGFVHFFMWIVFVLIISEAMSWQQVIAIQIVYILISCVPSYSKCLVGADSDKREAFDLDMHDICVQVLYHGCFQFASLTLPLVWAYQENKNGTVTGYAFLVVTRALSLGVAQAFLLHLWMAYLSAYRIVYHFFHKRLPTLEHTKTVIQKYWKTLLIILLIVTPLLFAFPMNTLILLMLVWVPVMFLERLNICEEDRIEMMEQIIESEYFRQAMDVSVSYKSPFKRRSSSTNSDSEEALPTWTEKQNVWSVQSMQYIRLVSTECFYVWRYF
jgi:hypothetical protein